MPQISIMHIRASVHRPRRLQCQLKTRNVFVRDRVNTIVATTQVLIDALARDLLF